MARPVIISAVALGGALFVGFAYGLDNDYIGAALFIAGVLLPAVASVAWLVVRSDVNAGGHGPWGWIIVGAAGLWGVVLGNDLLHGRVRDVVRVPLVACAGALGAYVLAATHGREERRRDASPRCARCGYDLRMSSERCPECGADLPEELARRRRIADELRAARVRAGGGGADERGRRITDEPPAT